MPRSISRGSCHKASLSIFLTAFLVQVVRLRGKCLGVVGYNVPRASARATMMIDLRYFLARPGEGVLVHYLWCEKMRSQGAQVSYCAH